MNMPIDSQTALNVVIGHPIIQSKSPDLHQKFYTMLGINAVLLAVDNPKLDELITAIKVMNIKLTAVTLPFKTQILKHVDVISDEVKALGAANTLLLIDGKIHAHNTDVHGIVSSLQEVNYHEKNILIIGAGGAARATGYALKDAKSRLYWMNRTQDKVHDLIHAYGGQLIEADKLNDQPFDIIINTTSVGMYPLAHETPLPGYTFTPEQTVFDLIYNPKETRLLQEARMAGAQIISGETLFVQQALKQITLCYGVEPEGRSCDELYNY
jgi:shikimate dehydrogenase